MSRSGQSRSSAATLRVPVIVVTGYLGSGKTTLISSLLAADDMSGTSVIVNELAQAGIDQAIIGDAGADDVVLLSNGCLCCAAGSDLRNAVAKLLDHQSNQGHPTKRIVIETSGAADPGPIIQQVCFDPVLRGKVRYGGTLTLFDAIHGIELLSKDPVGYRQIGLADNIYVTKKDLASSQQISDAVSLVSAANPSADVVDSADALIDYLLAGGRTIANTGISAWIGSGADPYMDAPHQQPLKTWTILAENAVDWASVERKLHTAFETGGSAVLRTKAIIHTSDDPRPLVIHGINRQFHRPVRLSRWDGEPGTRFVLIGFAEAANVAQTIATAIGGKICEGVERDNRGHEHGHTHIQNHLKKAM